MNINQIITQLMGASNPLQMVMSMLNPQQRQMANQLTSQNPQQQAQWIADWANQNNISKEQIAQLLSKFNR